MTEILACTCNSQLRTQIKFWLSTLTRKTEFSFSFLNGRLQSLKKKKLAAGGGSKQAKNGTASVFRFGIESSKIRGPGHLGNCPANSPPSPNSLAPPSRRKKSQPGFLRLTDVRFVANFYLNFAISKCGCSMVMDDNARWQWVLAMAMDPHYDNGWQWILAMVRQPR